MYTKDIAYYILKPVIFDHQRRIVKYRERTTPGSGYEYDFFAPPLRVESSGLARWGFDQFFQRACSEIFGIELVTSGSAHLAQNGREYTINAGEAYLLRKGCSHYYRVGPTRFLHKRYITIDGPILEQVLQSLGLHTCDFVKPTNFALLKRLFHEIDRLLVVKPDGYSIVASSIAYRVLLELSRSIKPQLPISIRTAMEFMQQHLREPLSALDFAKACGLSPTHFNRLFRQHVRTSPMSYFIEQRLLWARHLLMNTQLSIKEVAATVGYDDPFYFSSQFRIHMGASPRRFREQLAVDGLDELQPKKMWTSRHGDAETRR